MFNQAKQIAVVRLILITVFILILINGNIQTYANTVGTQQSTIGIKGRVLSSDGYDEVIPIDTYYKVRFDSTGGSAVSMQFVKENCNAVEPIEHTLPLSINTQPTVQSI